MHRSAVSTHAIREAAIQTSVQIKIVWVVRTQLYKNQMVVRKLKFLTLIGAALRPSTMEFKVGADTSLHSTALYAYAIKSKDFKVHTSNPARRTREM